LEYGRTQDQRTNKNLTALLDKHFNLLQISDTYGTNLFPYIKAVTKDAKIPQKDLVLAAKKFALPQREIVKPKLVICFGKDTFNAIRKALKMMKVDTVEKGINSPFFFNASKVYLQSHPCGRDWPRRGGINQIHADWAKMAEYMYAQP